MREKGMTTITLKKINRDKVYQYIYNQKETSKLQIVQDLQMGLSTVSQNLNELENDGLISGMDILNQPEDEKPRL